MRDIARDTLARVVDHLKAPGEVGRLRARLARAEGLLRERESQIEHLRAGRTSFPPERLVWVLGTARSGSTWLASMMDEAAGHVVWREPYVGFLFGRFYQDWLGQRHAGTKHFVLGKPQEEVWLRSIRNFVLEGVRPRFPNVPEDGYVVVKEPNGSAGAPLLLRALPESRVIFLVRDPRDVAASSLDAQRKGSWLFERQGGGGGERTAGFEMDDTAVVERSAKRYAKDMGIVGGAFDAHEGPKVVVRYEDLRTDALGEMERVYSGLDILVEREELVRAVRGHSWENIPAEERGEGKFFRKGTPGSWVDDLTPEQARLVERITGPFLKTFYG